MGRSTTASAWRTTSRATRCGYAPAGERRGVQSGRASVTTGDAAPSGEPQKPAVPREGGVRTGGKVETPRPSLPAFHLRDADRDAALALSGFLVALTQRTHS